MEANEAMKAMARRVVAKFYQGIRDHDYARWVLEGHKDDTSGVQIALAAIMETQESCAKLAENLEPDGDQADEAEYFLGACTQGEKIAERIRDGAHLLTPESDNG